MTEQHENPSSVKPFRIEKLDPKRHDRRAFESGSEPLDVWFHSQAGQQTRAHVAIVYILIEQATEKIAGFYTLSAAHIDSTDIDDALKRRLKLPKYPHLPVVLLGRLAVDKRYERQGLGRLMVVSAIKKTLELSDRLGLMALIVDAKDEGARKFYEHLGFVPFPVTRERLYLPVASFAGVIN